nr:reverse transcriptase domain-containing protein [Tanacetum cinerariifolium]
MMAMLKQFQSNPPPAQVKAVEEICVTCGGAHPYYQCLVADGNTFPEYRDNIQGYISAATGNYNQGNPGYRPQGVANQMRPPGSGTLPGNTIANSKGKLKAITTRSGLVTEGPTVPNPPKSVNPEEDECVEETYTDPDHAEYTIKVPPPPPVQKLKPPIQRNFVLHTRNSFPPHIPYPSRMLKQKQQEKDDIQIQKFWNMFKQLHLNITLAEALMTLELANRAICTPDKIARDVFVPVGKFTFPADFVVVDYDSDPRVPLILGRPFLRTARALIDVHGEEMILRDGDERLTLNMKHDTASYSNHPYRDSVNLIIFNISSEDCLEDLVSNKKSGNLTFSLHKEIASPKVIHEFHDSKGCTFLSEELPDIDSFNDIHSHFDDDPLRGSTTYSANSLLEEFADELALISYPTDYDDNQIESDANFDNDSFNSEGEKIKEAELFIDQLDLPCDILFEYDSFNSQDFSRDDELPDIDSFNDIHPYFDDDPLSDSTTYSANSLLEEFADELALISYPSDYDDYRACDIESDIREIEFLLFQEMFAEEQAPDYSFLPRFDVYPDDFLEIESDATFDDDSFDSKGEKVKEAELLIDQLDLPYDILSEYDSF